MGPYCRSWKILLVSQHQFKGSRRCYVLNSVGAVCGLCSKSILSGWIKAIGAAVPSEVQPPQKFSVLSCHTSIFTAKCDKIPYRAVQTFPSLCLSPSCSLSQPPTPSSGGMHHDWWKIASNCFRERSIHYNGNWSFLLLMLDQTWHFSPLHCWAWQ